MYIIYGRCTNVSNMFGVKDMKIQITSRWPGALKFEHECENNTVRKTLEAAAEQGSDLRGADLSGSDLQGAYLSGADLQGTYLSGSDLQDAYLRFSDLRVSNLRGANLRDANLSDANLSGANLQGAYLYCANLSGANLSDANLRGVDLQGAYLYGANLSGANLQGAYLYGANLRDANLSDANLSGADLQGAYLYGADLQGAYLRGADLQGSDLRGVDLQGVKNANLVIARTRILPEGDIIGYKKCQESKIVKMLIPKEAKRSHAFGRKCRAEYADVIEIIDKEGGKCNDATSDRGGNYIVGKRIYPNSFDDDWTDECSNGIHFFITKEEAEAW